MTILFYEQLCTPVSITVKQYGIVLFFSGTILFLPVTILFFCDNFISCDEIVSVIIN